MIHKCKLPDDTISLGRENLMFRARTLNRDLALYENVNQVSAYFAQMNPFWQESVWKTLLSTFNDMILEDSKSLLTGNYRQNIDVIDNLLSQSSIIGDYFSEGIYNYLVFSSRSNI